MSSHGEYRSQIFLRFKMVLMRLAIFSPAPPFSYILWISWTETNGKLPAHRPGLPGNVNIIRGSALTPVLESVAALPAGYPADLPVMMSKIHVI
jgi:hypothetical protein